MSGLIVRRDVILNSWTVIRRFGIHVYFRCLVARKNETFLSILVACHRL